MSLHRELALASAAVWAAWLISCSPSAGTRSSERISAGGTTAAGSGGSGTGTGSDTGHGSDTGQGSASGAGDGPGIITTADGGITQRDSGSNTTCGESVLEPEAVEVPMTVTEEINCTADVPEPLALYIVLDNSGSMKDNNKWTDAVTALTTFSQSDPSAKGTPWQCIDKDGNNVTPPSDLTPPANGEISVAIQYFHPENAGNNPNECDGSAHSTPAVPMGALPGNGSNIVSSLGSTSPNGDTPTVGALRGGVDYCMIYQAQNPGKKCVVVLVTDGQPNGCGLSSRCGGNNDCVDPASQSTLTPIAGDAFTTKDVITFTVGMSGVTADGFTLLDAIAVAGGSDCTPGSPGDEACNITTSGSQGFLDALNTIRKSVQVSSKSSKTVTTTSTITTTLPCEWSIPKPQTGQIDPTRVNVKYSTGGVEQRLGNVASQADCASVTDGWYYDDPNAPERILACSDTCTAIQSATDAKVSVLVGCKTEPAGVR